MSDAHTRGERVIAFIERFCVVPEGDLGGRPMRLEEFQKRFILDIYDNPYGTRRAYLSIARKNGKTGLIAAILLAHIAGPEARMNAQIVSGAMSREQAAQVFDLAAKMVRLSERLSRVIRIVPSTKHLVGLMRNVVYRALSAEGKTAHGASPVLAILDEVGQVEGPRSAFVSAITTSQGAYTDALLIAISTQAPTDADLFSLWLDSPPDPRVVKHIYAAPEQCALDDRSAWAAANPALGKFKALSDVEYEAKQAVDLPSFEAEFRNLSLNQRVEASSPFVSKAIWEANGAAPTPIEGRRLYLGLDLAEVQDLCALTAIDAEDGSVNATFWLPKEGLLEKAKRDHAPYDLWAKQDLLLTTPGKAVEYEFIAEHLRGVFDRAEVIACGFDRYNFKHLRPWLIKAGLSEAELARFVEFGQGMASMTPALRELEVKLLNAQLKHGGHPILTWNAKNAKVVGQSGARKFDKMRSRGRIDGMVALADAVGVMPVVADAPPQLFIF